MLPMRPVLRRLMLDPSDTKFKILRLDPKRPQLKMEIADPHRK
jgi:hypothetical protein